MKAKTLKSSYTVRIKKINQNN